MPIVEPDAKVPCIETPCIETPCNRVCVVDPVLRLCIGCGRSLDEIARWTEFTGAERLRIMAQLPARVAATAKRKNPALS
jgi:uncharacterized protein